VSSAPVEVPYHYVILDDQVLQGTVRVEAIYQAGIHLFGLFEVHVTETGAVLNDSRGKELVNPGIQSGLVSLNIIEFLE
jgi:hypothetical protein